MKVIFAWPPLKNPKGYPTIGQNRQFQWFKDPTFVYPIIPAIAATMLLRSKHDVLWLDAIAEEADELEFGKVIVQNKPDFIVFEAPTPLIGRYIEIINGIKQHLGNIKIILCGDHVTACMDEVKKECHADYFVAGGKWHKEVFKIIHGETWPQDKLLPHIDRTATRSALYAYRNGNYRFIPGTYIMSAFDCAHRPGCSFCSWAEYHKEYEVRPVDDVINEIAMLIQMGFKEIFDDSGTFPTGEWLREFCAKVVENDFQKYVDFGCNMRFGALEVKDISLLAQAGFRMILWGVESVSQYTLDQLNKGVSIDSISRDLILAKEAGLNNHLTVMFGFPWETYEEAKHTYNMVRYWLLKGYAWSAQASICIPYPITPLWRECKEKGLLLTEDWARYDMTEPVMKIPYSKEKLFALQRGIYNIAFHPKFLWHKLRTVRSMADLQYYLRIGQKIYDRFGHFYERSKVMKGA